MHRKGFTLVELSIVLIIVGFLIAGVTTGISLIKTAKLQSVINDLKMYHTAYNNFFARYSQIPGDYDNAIATLGVACNGNHDGIIGSAASNAELTTTMYELMLAGMISGQLTAANCSSGFSSLYFPQSKMGDGIYWIANGSDAVILLGNGTTVNTGFWANGAGVLSNVNAIVLGSNWCGPGAGFLNCAQVPYRASLTPLDAYQLDLKGDDGKPNTGDIRGSDGGWWAGQATCILGGSGAAATGYNITNDATTCIIAYGLN